MLAETPQPALRMRVAIVTETWPPEVNGVALTVQSLAHGLAALGHTIELVRPRQPGDTDSGPSPRCEHILFAGASMPLYRELRFGLPAQRALHRRWSGRRPNVVYIATEGPLGQSALGASRRLGIPACTGFHTRFDDFARHYGLGLLTPLVFAYLRRFHNRASATLVPTTDLAEFLGGHGFRNVQLLRRAVDTDLFHPQRRDHALRAQWGLTPGDLAVIHVGRLAPEKNLDLAVRAFEAIRQRQPSARLVIVGDGPARAALASRHPDILFVGIRRAEDLARYYASADLFLFPSLSETFGNVTIEALASGVPVVAFDYGAAREHIHDIGAGVLAPRDDEAAFVAAALELSTRVRACAATGATTLRDAARASVTSLSPASVARHFAQLLDRLSMPRAA